MKLGIKNKLIQSLRYLSIAVCIVLLFIGLDKTNVSFIRHLDWRLYDFSMRHLSSELSKELNQSVSENKDSSNKMTPLIIDIDEKSINELGAWPWARYKLGTMIELASKSGASSILFDILLSEQDPLSFSSLEERIKTDFNLELKSDLPELLNNNDKILSKKIENNPVILASFLGDNLSNLSLINWNYYPQLNFFSIKNKTGIDQLKYIPEVSQGIVPLNTFLDAGARPGFINVNLDSDGVVRRVPLLYRSGRKLVPSFALSSILKTQNTNSIILVSNNYGLSGIKVGELYIPLSLDGSFLAWFKNTNAYPRVSAVDFINGKVSPEQIKDKILLVGASAIGLKDLLPTPIHTRTSGIDIHATVIDNILTESFLQRPYWEAGLRIVVMFISSIIIAVLISFFPVIFTYLFAIAYSVLLYFLSLYFMKQGIYLSPLLPILSSLVAIFSMLTLKLVFERKQKLFLRATFSRYLAPTMVKRLMEQPDQLSLQGEEKELSILFTDIRKFTALSERLTPQNISAVLTQYFSPLTRIIHHNAGTVDKFIGDACMAFWNAPLDVPAHPQKALLSAKQILEAIYKINESENKFCGEKLNIGIGIHLGVVNVGNMGTKELVSYTCIGDAVNIASRLESLCSKYAVSFMTSDAVCSACMLGKKELDENSIFFDCDFCTLVWLDYVNIKGHPNLFNIYTFEHLLNFSTKEKLLYQKAARLYKDNNKKSALILYKQLFALRPDLQVIQVLCERCVI